MTGAQKEGWGWALLVGVFATLGYIIWRGLKSATKPVVTAIEDVSEAAGGAYFDWLYGVEEGTDPTLYENWQFPSWVPAEYVDQLKANNVAYNSGAITKSVWRENGRAIYEKARNSLGVK